MSGMRLPLAVGFSVALSLAVHALQTRFSIPHIRGAWVGLTCAVVMDMSVPERILVRAVLRACGSVVGAMFGIILVLVYEKLGPHEAEGEASHAQRVFQLFAIIFTAFACSVSVKLFKDFTYAFLLVLFTVAIALYPPKLEVAVEYMTSVCLGVTIAGVSLGLFHYPSAAQTVLDCYTEVLLSCMDFVGLSVCGSACELSGGRNHVKLVHSLTHKLALSHEALSNYICVHKFINSHKLTVQHLNDLSLTLRALYHRAHSVYLTLTHSQNADLFADEQFCEVFGYQVLRLKDTMLAVKEKLGPIHRRKAEFDSEKFGLVVKELEFMTETMLTLKSLYLKHQDGFLTTKNLRWPVLCLLITMAPVVAALTDYLIALAHFMTPYAQGGLCAVLETRLLKVKARIDRYLAEDASSSS